MRAQVLDGQIPGDVVVDVFFNLLRRVEIAHLKHPLVVNVADAGVENPAGCLNRSWCIMDLHIIELMAFFFANAKLRGILCDFIKFCIHAICCLADTHKCNNDALIIKRSKIFRQSGVTLILQGFSASPAYLHMRFVTAPASAVKLFYFSHTRTKRVQLYGGRCTFLIVCIKNAELHVRQCAKVVE